MEPLDSRPWSDLQPELLGLVLRRLPSLADRVRLRAVCHPWRAKSMFQSLPLPFPWLTLPDGTFLSIPSGEIHRISVPEGTCCHGSVDNWLFLMHNDDVCSLMNPLSKISLELPKLAKVFKHEIYDPSYEFNPIFYKLVVPSPLDSSPRSLVAAMIKDDGNRGTLCISQPPIAVDSFRDDNSLARHLGDIAFFDGKLYVLGMFGKLSIFELDKEIGISSMECIIDSLGDLGGIPKSSSGGRPYMITEYLVQCGGRLLMVRRFSCSMARSTSDDFFEHECTVALEVFEADLLNKPGRWRRASDLGGHALFLGQHSSKSVPATECSGYHEDCIYFMCDYSWPEHSANPLRDSGVYNMRNGKITPLLPGSAAKSAHHDGEWRPTWFFPPEVV